MLVLGSCGDVATANRAHAAQVAADHAALAGVSECSRQITPTAVKPLCSAGACIATPDSFAEDRGCRRDRDCEPLALTCQWIPISRRAPPSEVLAGAIAADRAGPPPPCITPVMPAVRCAFGFCSFAHDVHAP